MAAAQDGICESKESIMYGGALTFCVRFCSKCGHIVPRHARVHRSKRLQLVRTAVSHTGLWGQQYDSEVRAAVESHWKDKIRIHDEQTAANVQNNREKYYVLSMFPYPSGHLHMGHVRVYTISDTMARYHRLAGKQVIHPMGWDAFGLPAENAAIEKKVLPQVWTESNIEKMKTQLEQLCCSFEWNRELSTCDPNYYKWTQWIFLKMYEAGLAYQKEAMVNWDPVDQTVLADEQIDENGHSWRSGAAVQKRFLKQWYLKTTAYAKSLYEGLSEVDPELWKDIIDLQKHWIGECNGHHVAFDIVAEDGETVSREVVYTEQLEALYGAAFLLLSPDHPLCRSYKANDEDTDDVGDIQLPMYAVHPLTGQRLPVFLSTILLHKFTELRQSYLGIPGCSELDAKYAEQYRIPHNKNIISTDGLAVLESEYMQKMTIEEARNTIASKLKESGHEGVQTSQKLNDWLISRQRYWGTPIPIIHCPRKGTVPVPYEDLPVVLPEVTTFTGKGASPLRRQEDWLKVKCPGCDCGGHGHRETDTMDTFVDSSWYFLRYLDPNNTSLPFDPEKARSLMPVDLYIGGKEHAIMHLFYARFFNHFLHDQGLVAHREPFVNLLTQGMIKGQTFRLKDSGKYVPPSEIDMSGKKPCTLAGEPVVTKWEKMSKSKHNGVDPQDVLAEYGVDTTRLCILANVAPKSDRNWSHDVFKGILRWQRRMWDLVSGYRDIKSATSLSSSQSQYDREHDDAIFELRNYYVKEAIFHYEKTFCLNSVISRLQSLSADLKKVPGPVQAGSWQYERALCDLVILLAPFAPMFASELWAGITSVPNKNCNHYSWEKPVLDQSRPIVDKDYKLSLSVKKNNTDCFTIRLDRDSFNDLTKDTAKDLCQAHPDFGEILGKEHIQGVHFYFEADFKAELTYSVPEIKKAKKKKR